MSVWVFPTIVDVLLPPITKTQQCRRFGHSQTLARCHHTATPDTQTFMCHNDKSGDNVVCASENGSHAMKGHYGAIVSGDCAYVAIQKCDLF